MRCDASVGSNNCATAKSRTGKEHCMGQGAMYREREICVKRERGSMPGLPRREGKPQEEMVCEKMTWQD